MFRFGDNEHDNRASAKHTGTDLSTGMCTQLQTDRNPRILSTSVGKQA